MEKEIKLEIDVDELMEKIRDEVSNHLDLSMSDLSKSYDYPVFSLNGSNSSNNSNSYATDNHLDALLNDAETYSQIPTKFPDKFNRFPFSLSKGLQKFFLKLYGFLFKKQRVVNSSLTYVLKETLAMNRRLTEQVNVLQEQLIGMNARLTATEQNLSGIGDRVTLAEQNINGITFRLTAIEQYPLAAEQRFTADEQRITATEQRLNEVSDRVTTATEQVTAADERYFRNDSYLKNDLAQQKRLIALFLEEARQRLPEPFNQEQIKTFVEEEQYFLDAFYVDLEEQFRGSRTDIINRLKIYLPLIEEAKINTQAAPILDIGCGRGEWIELLDNSGYKAKGIDLNKVMVEQCQARGLDVGHGDAISYLQSLPDASLGVVTGFHIIEHLPFEVLIKLFDETTRVLKPNGLVIFETPNPQNVLVGSNTFYLDPTHRNPLPSALTKAMAEIRGLCRVKIMELNPYPEAAKVTDSDLADRFNSYFYGTQDYALVGYKA
jgi:O-antigen chain-terminating methyltransferase